MAFLLHSKYTLLWMYYYTFGFIQYKNHYQTWFTKPLNTHTQTVTCSQNGIWMVFGTTTLDQFNLTLDRLCFFREVWLSNWTPPLLKSSVWFKPTSTPLAHRLILTDRPASHALLRPPLYKLPSNSSSITAIIVYWLHGIVPLQSVHSAVSVHASLCCQHTETAGSR